MKEKAINVVATTKQAAALHAVTTNYIIFLQCDVFCCFFVSRKIYCKWLCGKRCKISISNRLLVYVK
jgi:hypothetical protein